MKIYVCIMNFYIVLLLRRHFYVSVCVRVSACVSVFVSVCVSHPHTLAYPAKLRVGVWKIIKMSYIMGLLRFAFAESEENLCVYSFHNFRIIIVILSAGIIRPKCVAVIVARA